MVGYCAQSLKLSFLLQLVQVKQMDICVFTNKDENLIVDVVSPGYTLQQVNIKSKQSCNIVVFCLSYGYL